MISNKLLANRNKENLNPDNKFSVAYGKTNTQGANKK